MITRMVMVLKGLGYICIVFMGGMLFSYCMDALAGGVFRGVTLGLLWAFGTMLMCALVWIITGFPEI